MDAMPRRACFKMWHAKRSDNYVTLADHAHMTQHSAPIVHDVRDANNSEITAVVDLCHHVDGCGITTDCLISLR